MPSLEPRDPDDPVHTSAQWPWLVAVAVVTVVLAGVDLSLPKVSIAAALVLTPFLASAGSRPPAVVATGAVAAAVAVALAFEDQSSFHASLARIVVILIGTAVAAQASSARLTNEARMVDLTSVAESAQRAILRRPPSRVGPVAVASWYQSAVRAATVGGDCYEALDTPFGARLLIADVRGHGLPSVRLAALVMGAFRTLAYVEADLVAVAMELDQLTSRHVAESALNGGDGEDFVTAVIAEVSGSQLRLVNCGHPPPVLVSPDGLVEFLDAPEPVPPLGIGVKPEPSALRLPAASRLLLYTDGIIEARNARGEYFDLAAAARGLVAGSLEGGVSDLIAQLRAHAGDRLLDDVALLAVEALDGLGAARP